MTVDTSSMARREMRELLLHWESQCRSDGIPHIETMAPVDIAPYLQNIMLVEVEQHTQRLRYRHVGENLTRVYGEQIEGAYLDEMPLRFRKFAEPAYREMLADPKPRYARFRFVENWWIATYERLMLPLLAMDEDRVAELVVAIYPTIIPKADAA